MKIDGLNLSRSSRNRYMICMSKGGLELYLAGTRGLERELIIDLEACTSFSPTANKLRQVLSFDGHVS